MMKTKIIQIKSTKELERKIKKINKLNNKNNVDIWDYFNFLPLVLFWYKRKKGVKEIVCMWNDNKIRLGISEDTKTINVTYDLAKIWGANINITQKIKNTTSGWMDFNIKVSGLVEQSKYDEYTFTFNGLNMSEPFIKKTLSTKEDYDLILTPSAKSGTLTENLEKITKIIIKDFILFHHTNYIQRKQTSYRLFCKKIVKKDETSEKLKTE
ncbi:hypothetical protein [[Mycoplasma] gypis]|uniref:Uncharacterized protein n=1 Tax=[Mycoplasma] gypis TaxID=92404 RepID=A0ABZ2RNF8_9BACT|nr:hypothetical protein [[Mycoplasma] gypis]MBN0919387.1 hypothetical protein [[Mycoplasma] gypis]